MCLISGCKAVRQKVVKVKRCPAQGGWRQGGIIRHWNRQKTERCPCQQQAAGKDVKIRRCRKQSRPSESNRNPMKRKWQHQTKMPVHTAINTQIVNRKMKETNLPRGDAVSGRASEAVRRRSYRLSLVFIAISTSRNFRHPACPGSTCCLNASCCFFVAKLPLTCPKLNSIPLIRAKGPLYEHTKALQTEPWKKQQIGHAEVKQSLLQGQSSTHNFCAISCPKYLFSKQL